MLRIHFRPEDDGAGGSGGSGGDGGTESPEDKATREAQEAEARRRSGSGGNEDMVPKREVQEANAEAKKLRDRAKAAEDELAKIKAAQMSDTEKAQADRDAEKVAREAAEKRARGLQVQVIASKLGIVDPSAAAQLLDWDTISDPDDEKSVEKALKDLVKEKPYLAGTAGGSDGGAGDGPGAGKGGQDMNALIRAGSGRG